MEVEQIMFLGEYQHSLDAKGRVILPSRYRARFAEGLVLTKGQTGCLYVYPREEFQRVAQQLIDANKRDVARMFFSGSSEDEPDGQGRVLIPEALRRYASLERDVSVVGTGNRMEIWDRARWEQHRAETEPEYSGMDDPDVRF
jgi:MraZ protein